MLPPSQPDQPGTAQTPATHHRLSKGSILLVTVFDIFLMLWQHTMTKQLREGRIYWGLMALEGWVHHHHGGETLQQADLSAGTATESSHLKNRQEVECSGKNMGSNTSKTTSSDILPLARPHPLNLSKECHQIFRFLRIWERSHSNTVTNI